MGGLAGGVVVSARRRARTVLPVVDVAATAVMTVVGIFALFDQPIDADQAVARAADAPGVGLVLATSLPLAFHRRFPVPTALISVAASAVTEIVGYGFSLPLLASLYLVGAAAYRTGWRTEVALAAFTTAVLVGAFFANVPTDINFESLLAIASAGALPAVLGHAMRIQRAHAVSMEERARGLRELHAIEMRQAADHERVRIAREVHDLVGHFLTGITLQARAARKRMDADPAGASAALTEIDGLASQALAETRHAVGAILAHDTVPDRPAPPTLDDLGALVTRLKSDEVRLRLHRERSEVIVPAALQTTAYRIVQESLSNVVRHAAPAYATITVRTRGGVLTIEVRDNGRPRARAPGGGIGLPGMSERAQQVGGSLQAGPLPQGGWRVLARLPLQPGEPGGPGGPA